MNRTPRAACRPLCGIEGGRKFNTTVEMQRLHWCFVDTFSPSYTHRNDTVQRRKNCLTKLEASQHNNKLSFFHMFCIKYFNKILLASTSGRPWKQSFELVAKMLLFIGCSLNSKDLPQTLAVTLLAFHKV